MTYFKSGLLVVTLVMIQHVTMPSAHARDMQKTKSYITETLKAKMAALDHVPNNAISKILAHLELTKKQKSQLSAFLKSIQRNPAVKRMQTDFRNKMMNAVKAGDMKKVDQLIDEMVAKKDEVYQKTMEGINSLLTDTQQAKMKSLIDEVKTQIEKRKQKESAK